MRIEDPEEMTPNERLRQVAEILAAGYLRLMKRALRLEGPLDEAAENIGKGAKDGPFIEEESSDFLRDRP